MKRLAALILALCLLPSPALATDRDFGPAQTYATLATAYAAAVAGDTLIGHGPATENNQTYNFDKQVYVQFVDGIYTFDGTGATGLFLRVLAAAVGTEIHGADLLVVTGYLGPSGVFLCDARCELYDTTITNMGAATAIVRGVYINGGTSSVVDGCTIRDNVDATTGTAYAVQIAAHTGGRVSDCDISGLRATGGSIRAVRLETTAVGGTLRDNRLSDFASTTCNAFDLRGAAAAGQVWLVQRNRIWGLAGGVASTYGFFTNIGTWKLDSNLVYASPNAIGIYLSGNLPDPTDTDCRAVNNTVNGCTRGFYSLATYTGTFRNNAATGNTTGFSMGATALVDSDYNQANGNGTDYDANWTAIKGAHDGVLPPVYVNSAGGDFHLLNTSPLIDAGMWYSGCEQDLDRQTRSGRGFDVGAYEFQQIGRRDVRGPVTERVLIRIRGRGHR